MPRDPSAAGRRRSTMVMCSMVGTCAVALGLAVLAPIAAAKHAGPASQLGVGACVGTRPSLREIATGAAELYADAIRLPLRHPASPPTAQALPGCAPVALGL